MIARPLAVLPGPMLCAAYFTVIDNTAHQAGVDETNRKRVSMRMNGAGGARRYRPLADDERFTGWMDGASFLVGWALSPLGPSSMTSSTVSSPLPPSHTSPRTGDGRCPRPSAAFPG